MLPKAQGHSSNVRASISGRDPPGLADQFGRLLAHEAREVPLCVARDSSDQRRDRPQHLDRPLQHHARERYVVRQRAEGGEERRRECAHDRLKRRVMG